MQSCSKLRLNLRKISQSYTNLHKLSECHQKCITVVESNTKLNEPTSKMPQVALKWPSSLGNFHNFGATFVNFDDFGLLFTFSPVTLGIVSVRDLADNLS